MASRRRLHVPFASQGSVPPDDIDIEIDSAASITVGCAELPPGKNRAAYFRALPLLEMRLPGDRIPAPSVADRWRADAGSRQLALVAPRALLQLRAPGALTPVDLESQTAALAETAARIRAAAVVFITPPDLSPSSAHRDLLRSFFDEVATADRFGGEGGSVRVWQPDGLWRPVVADALAQELGLVAAIDPLAADTLEEGIPEAGEIAYARVTGLGRPSRPLGTDDLEQLVEWAAPSRRAFIVFATPTRYQDAIALSRALA